MSLSIASFAGAWPHSQSNSLFADTSIKLGTMHRAGALLLLLVLCAQADDKKKHALYTKPAQAVDLENEKYVTAKQNCESWGLAAGLETILKRQDVHLDQNFWVTRIHGGELCVPDLPSVETLTHAINGEFVLEDGRHVRLELHYISGAPTNIDDVVAGIQRKRLSLLLFRGHAYYLTGVTYDEFIAGNGSRFFGITEMRLADTFPKMPGTTFQKGRDDATEISGTLSVSVFVK